MDTAINQDTNHPCSHHSILSLLLMVGFSLVVLIGMSGCFDSGSEDASLTLETPGGTSGDTGSQTPTSQGATLYTNNCAMCHGADAATISDKTANGITTAITIIPSMQSIQLTSSEIQSIADYLLGNTSGGGGGTGGGGTLDGQALFTANCSGCHGDGSSINGRTVTAINDALSNLGVMSGVAVTAEEIQAISDFLTGSTGGGGGDTGGGGGTLDGQALFTANCSGCHGDGSNINGRTVTAINDALNNLGIMSGVSVTAEEIQAISDFLTGSTGGGGTGTSDGQALFNGNCSGCHTDASTLSGRTAAQIATAIVNIPSMTGITLSGTEIQSIADFLGGGTGGGGGTSGPPSNHTNSEDGVLHAPGNDLPYTNGCTVCHGPTLEGGAGPSCFACHDKKWSENPPTGGGTGGGSTDGQSLYTTYCAACHGATGSSLTGRTVDQINTAISNVGSMSGIALSLTQVQAIADYLAGSSGGGGGTGGGGTLDGQTLYESYCAGCHGADAATISDRSASGITNALSNIGSMTGISLSAEEVQAISDYLMGSTGGGGTGGGGDTGGLPPTHTNSEEGVMHADGNNYPFTNNCTTCHGTTLEGGIGPSCFACHGVEWNESAPTGGGGTGGTLDGQALFTANCSACHGDGSNINGRTVTAINSAINNIGAMGSVSLTTEEIQAISDFLTGSTGGGGTGGGGTTDGLALYTANCSACHGATGSNINGRTTSAIQTAIASIGVMNGISLTTTEIQSISDYLTGGSSGGGGGGTGGGGDTGGVPSTHTNMEDGVPHAPGNNYPYSNGCATCHGSTLQGGIGPSCFACHGQEWNESAPSGDGGSTGGGGGTSTDGQSLYTSFCAACHGATGSSINGRTASAISTAIANVGAMSSLSSLTSTEVQAIADYLAGSTGGGSTGGGTGGLPASHTNNEEGVLHAPGNNYPYTNGCTSCHGSTLQGDIGPSCYSCHGQEWTESSSSGGSYGGSESSSSEEEHD